MQTSLKSIENPNNGLKLMSSKDIADYTGKNHKDVMRDIRVMCNDLQGADLRYVCNTSTYISENGQSYPMYQLDKKTSLNLISGYDSITRMKIINRWEVLENQSQKTLSRTDLAKMVIEAEEEKEKLLLENAELKSKADYTDKVLNAESCHHTSSIAKEIGFRSAQVLHKILNEKGILYNNGQMWVLYAKYSGLGYTSTRTSPYYDTEGRLKTNTVTVWTEKGREFIHSLLNK